MLTLDVGCGDKPRGSVNLDYRLILNPEIDQLKKRIINIRLIPNFIQADAQHLPLRDKIFNRVFCYHVIEHVDNPYLLLNELLRASNNALEIRCPHRFSCNAKMPYHKHYFNKSWLARFFKNHKIEVDTIYWFPIKFSGLIRLPHEIRIEVIQRAPLSKR